MLEVADVVVAIRENTILYGSSLVVEKSQVVAVLGPSGSGKSTLLKTIAGLVSLTSGDIRWNGESILDVPTHQRRFGLMFQGYALFPHMDVAGNVGFGLRMAGDPDIEGDVALALEQVGLGGFERRSVDTLSGGERQRVALARTLAPEPRLVMLDEPLGALDRNLRRDLIVQTREILIERSVTAIVVTHDREEAVEMSDRLALMRDGRIVQTGSLDDILANPADRWVSDFLK